MRKLPIKPDRDNPAWSDEDFRRAKPALDVLPAARGPQRAPAKQLVSLRIDRDVVARFRATGDGWQTRVNEALKRAARSLR